MKSPLPCLTLALALAGGVPPVNALSSPTADGPAPLLIDLAPNNASIRITFNAAQRTFTMHSNFYGDRSVETRPCEYYDEVKKALAANPEVEGAIKKIVADGARAELNLLTQKYPAAPVLGNPTQAVNHYADLMLVSARQAIAFCDQPKAAPQ